MQLEAEGHRCTSISGELDHEQRDRTVKEFRSGTTKILISTDVLSRGFDVTQACPAHTLCFHSCGCLSRQESSTVYVEYSCYGSESYSWRRSLEAQLLLFALPPSEIPAA